jgi:hypothetical protein
MASTTIDRSAPSTLLRSLPSFAFAVLLAVVLVAGAYAIGRATAPNHTIRSIVTAPAAPVDRPTNSCPLGRAC